MMALTGVVMANMRSGIRDCPGFYAGAACRAISTSTDQGETFRVGHDGRLISPICQVWLLHRWCNIIYIICV